jgi:hypothetical protein
MGSEFHPVMFALILLTSIATVARKPNVACLKTVHHIAATNEEEQNARENDDNHQAKHNQREAVVFLHQIGDEGLAADGGDEADDKANASVVISQ